jgi:hypothetical protein
VDMTGTQLEPFLPRPLDVLFIALNPPQQSHSNGHYFLGEGSRFFKLLAASGLITREIPQALADDVVFGGTEINYAKSSFGVIDLVDDLVETNSARVQVTPRHVHRLKEQILDIQPRFACVIHSKVRDGLNRHGGLSRRLKYGWCGAILPDCDTEFLLNYFPNGNSKSATSSCSSRLRISPLIGRRCCTRSQRLQR